jgi:FixJ family two-component response regulator
MAEKILIVDDEQVVRSSIGSYLEDQGYETSAARDGVEALKAFDGGRPDLVVLDLRLPGMDGLDILREIRSRAAEVPVVIVSGAGQIDDVVQALRLGAWDYLFKPIRDLSMLRHSVQTCLERARLIRENKAYRTHLEELVAKRTAELEAANISLQRKTVALEEVLATYRADADRRVTRAIERIGQFCKPVVEELRRVLPPAQRKLADRIESAVSDAGSDTVDKLSDALSALSPAELRVCDMIRRGMGSKEIAVATGISVDTVETHRRNIRRKLKITNESVNLSTFLHQRLGQGASAPRTPNQDPVPE